MKEEILKDRVQELEIEVKRLRHGVKDIMEHQKIVAGSMHKLSVVYNIAARLLKGE